MIAGLQKKTIYISAFIKTFLYSKGATLSIIKAHFPSMIKTAKNLDITLNDLATVYQWILRDGWIWVCDSSKW